MKCLTPLSRVLGLMLSPLMLHASGQNEISRQSVPVPMRDGVMLETNLYRDSGIPGPMPVLMLRTPYDQEYFEPHARRIAGTGYIAITQDCRGRHGSGGEFSLYWGEGRDGFDAVEWIREQDWCNGRVGTWGGSYMGGVQWLAAAEGTPLDALSASGSAMNFYYNIYLGGTYLLALGREGFNGNLLNPPPDPENPQDWEKWLFHLPITELDQAVGRPAPWRMSLIRHNRPNGFWRGTDASLHVEQMNFPAQHFVGYYDFFLRETVRNFQRMRGRSATSFSRDNQQLILGPWDHGGPAVTQVEDVSFGKSAALDELGENLAWFDRFMKGIIDPDLPYPRVRYFMMGSNTWHTAADWPPPESTLTPLYLHSGGNANTREGAGSLKHAPPRTRQPTDQFISDPDNPVLAAPAHGREYLHRFGPFDQQIAQDRDDVLVYSTEPLDEPLAFAGALHAQLYVSADTPDADWVVRVIDTHPDGFAHPLATGVLRGSARDSELHLSPMEPGRIYQIHVDLGHCAARIDPGHKLSVQIAGSNFPVYDRNLHTGEGPAGTRSMISTEMVYHTRSRASRIFLHLINLEGKPPGDHPINPQK